VKPVNIVVKTVLGLVVVLTVILVILVVSVNLANWSQANNGPHFREVYTGQLIKAEYRNGGFGNPATWQLTFKDGTTLNAWPSDNTSLRTDSYYRIEKSQYDQVRAVPFNEP
jgi:hypothetical protein